MTSDGLTRHAGRVGRRSVWLWVIATLLIATAIIVAWAPRAQAQANPTIRDLEVGETLPGRFHPLVYTIHYKVRPLINREDCDLGWRSLNPFSGGIAGQQISCTKFDLGAIADLFFGMSTELSFEVTRVASAYGFAVTHFAYSFDVAEWLDDPAREVATKLRNTFVVGDIHLDQFMVFIAVFYSGFHILRKRTAMGLRELLTSLLVAAIGLTMIAERPGWVLDSALPHAIAMSGAMLELSSGSDEPASASRVVPLGSDNIVAPATDALYDAQLGQPYDLINWGAVLKEDACVKARDDILKEASKDMGIANIADRAADGPGGRALENALDPDFGDWARDEVMRKAGDECKPYADFNADPSGGRLMAAILSGVIAIIVNLMLALIAVAIIGAQLVLAQLLAIAPLAVVVGIVPGAGRELLAKWVGAVGQALAAVVVMSFVLTLYIELATVILGAETGGYFQRFFVLLIAVIMLFRGRKKLLNMSEQVIERTLERLAAREEGRGSADFGSLLEPGNLLKFGAGAYIGQQVAGALPGMVGRALRAPFRGRGGAGAVPGGGAPGGALPAGVLPPGAIPGTARPVPARPQPGRHRGPSPGLTQRLATAARATGRGIKGLPYGLGRVAGGLVRSPGRILRLGGTAGRAGGVALRRTPGAIGHGIGVGARGIGHGGAVAYRGAIDAGRVSVRATRNAGAFIGREYMGGFRDTRYRTGPLQRRLERYANAQRGPVTSPSTGPYEGKGFSLPGYGKRDALVPNTKENPNPPIPLPPVPGRHRSDGGRGKDAPFYKGRHSAQGKGAIPLTDPRGRGGQRPPPSPPQPPGSGRT